MKSARSALSKMAVKTPTGISGFDAITGGGLPRGRTTVLLGGPGTGKTLFALQFLVHGARDYKEPGIFVAFEETSKRLMINAESFGWKLAQLRRGRLFFIDAQPMCDLIHSGDFDLSGMLAALEDKTKAMKARRIVFDALDVLLALLPSPAAQRREVYKLHEWLLARELTGLITLKSGDETGALCHQPFGFMQFMVDCAVILNHQVVQGVSQRNLRVLKYRGSRFDENESPFVIGEGGLEVAVTEALGSARHGATDERVSSGVARLDSMLGGGYFRGASVLITGLPGTAKTTLGAAFAEAACRRGERTLFVIVDSDVPEVIRNLASVGIRLDRYTKTRCLRMISARTIIGSAETYLVHIKTLTREHRARCLVIDPVSTLAETGNEVTAHSVAERLLNWSKAGGTTLVCTSTVDEMSSQEDSSPLRLSPLADTWIHLSYQVQAGERNRGLSIIKSRGTAHSNRLSELTLSDAGLTLTAALLVRSAHTRKEKWPKGRGPMEELNEADAMGRGRK